MPRVAVGALPSNESADWITLALLRWASRRHWRTSSWSPDAGITLPADNPIPGSPAATPSGCPVQHFHACATHFGRDPGLLATGYASRHLDSWTMDRQRCRLAVSRCLKGHELVVVEGRFENEDLATSNSPHRGSRLNELCWWLDLPRVAVVQAEALGDCRLPRLPEVCDAVLLDGVVNARHFRELQTTLEPLWGVPVLGGLEQLQTLRRELASLPHGARMSSEALDTLADSFGQLIDAARFSRLVNRRPGLVPAEQTKPIWCIEKPLVVAVAFDEAFFGYMPGVLDELESLGATIVVFSPMRDEGPPANADLIWLGEGRPQDFAETLANNRCMLAGLHNHIAAGRRVYAERGGMAYLCQRLRGADGQWHSMLGVVPAAAWHEAGQLDETPVEVELAACCWLGRKATRLRGYRSAAWQFEPLADSSLHVVKAADRAADVLCHRRVVASRLAVDFAGQASLLQAIVEPLAVKPLPIPVATAG